MAQTLVCFHAHPDDEALLTAGVMARASSEGHRVVLVVATRGDVGQVAGDFLGEGEALADRRWRELERAAEVLGVADLQWLGYRDSGHAPAPAPATVPAAAPAAAGTLTDEASADPSATAAQGRADTPFTLAPLEEAADRLADILRREHAEVLTSYDPNGGYGHPDHVQVHRVGRRAGEAAGTPIVLEATFNRDLMRVGLEMAGSLGFEIPPDFAPESFDNWYTPAAELTHAVDVRPQLAAKRAAMEAHASQATSADDRSARTLQIFATLPAEYFELAFGTEWFVDRRRAPGIAADDVFAPRPDPE